MTVPPTARHTSAWYISEWLRIAGDSVSAHAKSVATTYLQFAGGTLRAMYPSGMPDGLLARWAYQTGAPNNASVEIPVEDYRWPATRLSFCCTHL